jgi:murein DD-endopeptidase MepM/ murein hydrolase activator NlpD
MTTSRRTSHTRRNRRGPIAFILLALVAGICFASGSPANQARAGRASSSYGWPVKPFYRQHAIRGYFGDPRTVFSGRPSFRNLMSGPGAFSYHFGVDICAPDGTAVYAVRSGTAAVVGTATDVYVQVSSDDGFAAQYWHVVPAVHTGQNVVAYQTVIGHVAKAAHHVHFSELENGQYVNPLAPGHLAPYADHTKPEVSSISFRSTAAGREIAPEFLHGRIHLIADAYDLPAMRVQSPARWRGLPVAPALLQWRVEQVKTGKVVVGKRTAFDVRTTLPTANAFWEIYARGSHQNMLQFTTHRFWQQPGRYLYRLSRGAFDTRRLSNGIYRVIVSATDTRGNSSSSSQLFTVYN